MSYASQLREESRQRKQRLWSAASAVVDAGIDLKRRKPPSVFGQSLPAPQPVPIVGQLSDKTRQTRGDDAADNGGETSLPIQVKFIGGKISVSEWRTIAKRISEVMANATVKIGDITGASRREPIATVRLTLMYILREHTLDLRSKPPSLAYIGKLIGGRDHTTVVHSCKSVKKRMDDNEGFRTKVEGVVGSFSR
jgi:hypothetical protein